MDMKIAAADAVRAQHDVSLATLKASHEELQRKHNEGIAELRNRATALEGRTSSVEQGAAELRAQMNAVVQAVARVEAKQDREAQALEQIRRDLLEFVVNPNRR
jgi:septation ring formation regulator EzrA